MSNSEKKIPSVKEIMEMARQAGYDSLGIGNDPEALEALKTCVKKMAQDPAKYGFTSEQLADILQKME